MKIRSNSYGYILIRSTIEQVLAHYKELVVPDVIDAVYPHFSGVGYAPKEIHAAVQQVVDDLVRLRRLQIKTTMRVGRWDYSTSRRDRWTRC